MDAHELGRWTRFAAKGGIGKCTATQDCVAEEPEDLMFLKDDEIVVLMQLPGQEDMYLGYCEGVVGRFRSVDVRFHGRLKKPVMTKRSSRSLSRSSSRPSSSHGSASPMPTSSGLAQRASPSMQAAPSRTSLAASISVTEDATTSTGSSPIHVYTSPPLPPESSPHLPAPSSSHHESLHLRSASHSSGSTALDSAPRTPADIGKDEHATLMRVVSPSQQADSPTNLHTEQTIRHVHEQYEASVEDGKRNSPDDTMSAPAIEPASPGDDDTYSGSPTWLDISEDDINPRVSVALSDGEVGIGLSLLQDFAGDNDDTTSTRSSVSLLLRSGADPSTPTALSEISPAGPLVRNSMAITERSSVYSTVSHSSSQVPLSPPLEEPRPPFAASLRSVGSRSSLNPSISDSEYGGEEWEGASDIYDNYRYSRYSVASKMSRFSKSSMHTVASGLGLEPPPPVPTDGPRPSSDGARQNPARERLASVTTTSSSVNEVRVAGIVASSPNSSISIPSPTEVIGESKRVPPPLELVSSNHGSRKSATTTSPLSTSSPLLHATFNSPMSSPQFSSSFASPLSEPLTPPLFSHIPGGAASALRQRLEQERNLSATPDVTHAAENGTNASVRLSTQPVIVDDSTNEAYPRQGPQSPSSLTHSATEQSPPSSPSILSEKKRMIETTYYVANQAPPPPYTPMSPVASASHQLTAQQPQALSPPSPPQVLATPGQPTLRPVNPESQKNLFIRRSIFAPHPHAPKPAEVPIGPMYGRQPDVQGQYGASSGPPPGSAKHTLHLALAARGDPMRPRHVTIYGKFDYDLSAAMGPVPILFTLEPPNNIPANRLRTQGSSMSPVVGEYMSAQEAESSGLAPLSPSQDTAAGKVIPRANFFPKTQTPRPRSRSFSGFESPVTEVIISEESSSQNGIQQVQVPSVNALAKRSKSAHVPSASTPSHPSHSAMISSTPGAARTPHRPSPLSFSRNNTIRPAVESPHSPKAPTSPLAQPSVTAPSPTQTSPQASEVTLPSPTVSLRQTTTAMTSPPMTSPPLSPEPATARPMVRQISGSSSGHSTAMSPVPTTPTKHHTFHMLRHSRSSGFVYKPTGPTGRDTSPSRSSIQGRPSVDFDATHSSDIRSSLPSPTPFTNGLSSLPSVSLRSKLSMPTLRIRTSERPSLHEERSPTLSLAASDHSDQPTVSVKDMNFELVKPTGQLASISEDGSLPPPLPSPSIRGDTTSSLRAESPAFSVISASSSRTGTAQLLSEFVKRPTLGMSLKAANQQEVEAHRQRELRWISLMASTPASQARKNKKVRKLLWEGVPASVRYLVWAHLTDSTAKRMEGLFAKLVKRERVAASASIERDVQRVFTDEPPLLDGSLVNLLQAYLSMVPDVTYSRGLTVIAGRLLMQSPEEDAFWTFVSLMDTHLRPYFSAHPIQMDIDASLFGKAVEANEPSLAKKVFVDMDIPPASLCRPWFTAIFMEALPSEHAQRVWDVFLFEGVTFLFRAGLAIVQCCKEAVLALSAREAVLNTLLHPPVSCLPSSADVLLDIAASVKLKDDEIRKQRTKLEAQVKRKTQARPHGPQTTVSGGPLPISLPRS